MADRPGTTDGETPDLALYEYVTDGQTHTAQMTAADAEAVGGRRVGDVDITMAYSDPEHPDNVARAQRDKDNKVQRDPAGGLISSKSLRPDNKARSPRGAKAPDGAEGTEGDASKPAK